MASSVKSAESLYYTRLYHSIAECICINSLRKKKGKARFLEPPRMARFDLRLRRIENLCRRFDSEAGLQTPGASAWGVMSSLDI